MTGLSVSAAVQAHPSRRAMAEALAEQLDAQIAWSQAPGDVWDTHKRARLLCHPGADWNLVVQDDAVLAADFERRLMAMLDEHGADYSLFCLFFRPKSKHKGFAAFDAAGDAGLAHGGFAWPNMQWAIGTVVASALVPDMIEFCDRLDIPEDDVRMTRWAHARGLSVWYPLPSLTDHQSDALSLIGHGPNKGRTAKWFAG